MSPRHFKNVLPVAVFMLTVCVGWPPPTVAQAGGRAPGVAAQTSERTPGVYVAPEERIARLEAALAKANARLAALETKFAQHTHLVPGWEIGLVREKINGRNIELAFGPRRTAVQSGPPAP
jgi:hypothetical protein